MISIKNINKWYGDFQVLTNCSTEVSKGEVVVVRLWWCAGRRVRASPR